MSTRPPDIMWRLQTPTVRHIVCETSSTRSGIVLLTVTLDDEPVLEEIYPDFAAAAARAATIRERLLGRGWASEVAA